MRRSRAARPCAGAHHFAAARRPESRRPVNGAGHVSPPLKPLLFEPLYHGKFGHPTGARAGRASPGVRILIHQTTGPQEVYLPFDEELISDKALDLGRRPVQRRSRVLISLRAVSLHAFAGLELL